MFEISDILTVLPPMKAGTDILSDMALLPVYDDSVCFEQQTVRLMKLSDLYGVYVPSVMSIEIYNKVYLSLMRSLQKKCSRLAITQRYENFKAIKAQEYNSIMGGTDSFTIIGTSGIGKSTAIARTIELITENRIIEVQEPYCKIVPCVVVQCPFDSSVKGMLLEILRKVDEALGTDYYVSAAFLRNTTTDMLIGMVSQIALNHIGILIVDEIQNVVNSKNGKSLIGSLTQLINNSGISIAMVGVPECIPFFEQAMQLARRSVGLTYTAMQYGSEFIHICTVLFEYQYVQKKTELTEDVLYWLYEHSGGVISIVVALLHDAQELAILSGKEILSLETLHEAYQKRLSMLHGYLNPKITHKSQTSRVKKQSLAALPVKSEIHETRSEEECSLAMLVSIAKIENRDVVSVLKEYIPVIEVAI